MAELSLTLPTSPSRPQRQDRTESGRRAKIGRGVAEAAVIVRIIAKRTDDDGRPFRTTFSLDGALFALASRLWGGEDAARARLAQLAETFWASDRRARERAQALNESFGAPRSVSRHIQSVVVAAAAARLDELDRQGVLRLPASDGSVSTGDGGGRATTAR